LHEHVQAGVILNQVFELGDDGVEVFRVAVDMIDDTTKPFLMCSMVSGKPITYSVDVI